MGSEAREYLARQLMAEFVSATGLDGAAPPRRYVWTDAFAVTNLLSFDRELALRLIDQVHHVLGRHRADDSRHGWISGLSDAEGERHPTRGGLRIGKPLPERGPDEPFDDRLEWERDGQYFHYLTQWMRALARARAELGQATFHAWAIELAQAAHAGFSRQRTPGGPRRMVWKMSIDLSRPLVASMGQHDPLDAWITYLELQGGDPAAPLRREIAEAAVLGRLVDWETDDALGVGGLLVAVFRLARLIDQQGLAEGPMLSRLLASARTSLDAYARRFTRDEGSTGRLAFRELGLAIGLHAIERVADLHALPGTTRAAIASLLHHQPLATRIDESWSDPEARRGPTWEVHHDINTVMLATSLAPDGYLGPVG